MLCYGLLVSELGGPRVHGAPQPRHCGGACAPVPPGSAAYGDLTNEKFTIHHVIWAYIHTYKLLIIYVITDENKLQLLYYS